MSLVFFRDLIFNLNPPGGLYWIIDLPVRSMHVTNTIYVKSDVDRSSLTRQNRTSLLPT